MMLVGKAANFNYCDAIDKEKISENKSQQFIIMSEIPRFLQDLDIDELEIM